MKQVLWVIHLAQTVCIRRVNSDAPVARIFGPYSKAEANARLIVAATNAAKEINPENPQAAAEAMPEMWRLISDALPIIEREAEDRDAAMQTWKKGYQSEMREIANRIEALISKATKK